MQEEPNKYVKELTQEKYKYGFTTDVHTDIIEKGLNEDVIRLISAKKEEPEWLLEFRLKAYRHWLTMEMPTWAHLTIPEIDYQAISYYADPTKKKEGPKSLDEVDPELIKTFNKLGIPLHEQRQLSGMAVDAVMDSVSVKTTFRETLLEKGIIFCSFSEAVKEHPDLVQKYMGSVVGYRDNFFAALNSAVFSDGSFVYIPKGVRCPMELSTYFRINAANTGQFERTLIVADDDSYVSYLEGCTAPQRDENQLHAAIVEIVVHDRAEVKYSTVQNWYPGDAEGKGGIYNFVTKRGHCKGVDSKLSWTQVETGSAITWKYPSCILSGDNSTAEFYSVAVTNNYQQADTGTKMIHLGKNTRSTIVSKGISAGKSQNSYRGLVRVAEKAENARNYSQCDSLLLGSNCGAHTFPYMDIHNETAVVEHEATTSKITNYPGFPQISGQELFECFDAHRRAAGIDITEKTVTNIMPAGNGFMVLADNEMYEARTLILCMGVMSAKQLDREDELLGKRLSYCATCDGMFYKDKRIAVICNDKKYEHEVKYLADLATEVLYFPAYNDSEIELPNVKISKDVPIALIGDSFVEGITLRSGKTESVDGVFCLRNAIAPSKLMPQLEIENEGMYIGMGVRYSKYRI